MQSLHTLKTFESGAEKLSDQTGEPEQAMDLSNMIAAASLYHVFYRLCKCRFSRRSWSNFGSRWRYCATSIPLPLLLKA